MFAGRCVNTIVLTRRCAPRSTPPRSREGRQQARPKEDNPAGRDRPEPVEEPEGQQRLGDESPAKASRLNSAASVRTMRRDGPEPAGVPWCRTRPRQPHQEKQDRDAHGGIKDEDRLAGAFQWHVRHANRQGVQAEPRPDGGSDRADEVVLREEARPVSRFHQVRELRLLQR